MKKMFSIVVVMAALASAPNISHAQDSTKAANKKTDMRKALREKWQNATPEEKEKMKGRMREMKAKYDSLPPEKQKEIKEKIKTMRATTPKS